MNLSRRNFLGFLGATGTLAALPPILRAAVEGLPEIEAIKFDGASAMALAHYACDRLDWELGRQKFAAINFATDQFGVQIEDISEDSPESFKAVVDAAIFGLKNEFKHRRMNAFGVFQIPRGLEQCATCANLNNVSIRFLKAYDIFNGRPVLRFDVAGARV